MHANTQQLLEIKDGIKNEVNQHVESCDHCRAELSALCEITEQIFNTANQNPPAETWEKINSSIVDDIGSVRPELEVPLELLSARPSTSSINSLPAAIYTLAGSILITGFIGLFLFGQQNSANQQTQVLQASIQELMLNSRGMEQVLQRVVLQNELISTDDQNTAERLYWRLTHLDQMIQDNNDDPERIQTLWNGRVNTLSELNELYYQQQNNLIDSEI